MFFRLIVFLYLYSFPPFFCVLHLILVVTALPPLDYLLGDTLLYLYCLHRTVVILAHLFGSCAYTLSLLCYCLQFLRVLRFPPLFRLSRFVYLFSFFRSRLVLCPYVFILLFFLLCFLFVLYNFFMLFFMTFIYSLSFFFHFVFLFCFFVFFILVFVFCFLCTIS